jgi:acetylornithine deacetylase/succinyl-diaminopimelate desuccinylase-like protein
MLLASRAVQLTRETEAVASLRAILRKPTICTPGAELSVADVAPFEAAIAHITTTYRDLLSREDVTVDEVNSYSLLITWAGSEPGLPPVLFNGHYDVVPAGNTSAWQHGPFSADLVNGCVDAIIIASCACLLRTGLGQYFVA